MYIRSSWMKVNGISGVYCETWAEGSAALLSPWCIPDAVGLYLIDHARKHALRPTRTSTRYTHPLHTRASELPGCLTRVQEIGF